MKRRWLVWLVCLALYLVAAEAVAADGFIIPVPPPGRPLPPQLPTLYDLTIKYHRVTVTIDDQVATTHVDQVFVNEPSYEVEGEYIFPLPEGASISALPCGWTANRWRPQVLERDEARRIYEDIVRAAARPGAAGIRWAATPFGRASTPSRAHGEKRVEIEYSEVLPQDAGLVRYVYPLNTEKFSARPLEEVSVQRRDQPRAGRSRRIYSPSHDGRDAARRASTARGRLRRRATCTPDKDFVLYYTVGDDDLGVNLLSYNEEGEDGFFLLLLAPRAEADGQRGRRQGRLSRAGYLGQHARRQAGAGQGARPATCWTTSTRSDRFNIIAFSTGTRPLCARPAPRREVARRARFVNDLRPRAAPTSTARWKRRWRQTRRTTARR